MEQSRICPFMSTEDKKVRCLRERCQLWFSESPGGETLLGLSNCSLACLPLLVLEISNNTRLMKASMEDSVAI
jgi:hypothetical protein